MWSGRAFQVAGPACENARSPNRLTETYECQCNALSLWFQFETITKVDKDFFVPLSAADLLLLIMYLNWKNLQSRGNFRFFSLKKWRVSIKQTSKKIGVGILKQDKIRGTFYTNVPPIPNSGEASSPFPPWFMPTSRAALGRNIWGLAPPLPFFPLP